ncbi:MAG: aminopeptidase, partial [Atopobiaceae bacterium]|nr:aminopeptidase [Atopobiaceae bacterium]
MTIPMTDEECRIATEALSPQLDRYAALIVRKGCAIKPGQQLVVTGPIERADFVRRVVRAAYEAGSGPVTVLWDDDEITRLTFEHNDLEFFENVPEWKRIQLNSLAEDGAAFLRLEGEDPMKLKGIDPMKPAVRARAFNTQCDVDRKGMQFGLNVWCIVGVPVVKWAKTIFPDLSDAEAVYRLWLAILSTARADGDDPHEAWETHNATFEKNKRMLNEARFDSLRYRSSNGTDLTIGLPAGHIWEGGAARTVGGTLFFPNMPTEEVFTSPDRLRVEGTVHSALPLVHSGSIVRDFWFRFEGGAVVDYGAAQGKEVLKQILTTDENAVRLGEVALVSKNTPIRQSGLLFFSTLYDENASCHLALG